MAESYNDLAGKLRLRCPVADIFLARDWIKQAFDDIINRRQWSWRLAHTYITTPAQYSTGTATIAAGDVTVTLAGGGLATADLVGQQFRVGQAGPIMTISAYDGGANTLTLSDNWPDITYTAVAYFIYQAYISLPTNFHAPISMVDPSTNNVVDLTMCDAEMIDAIDPQRSVIGIPPTKFCHFDYYNGMPRYEFWPHIRQKAYYGFLYETMPPIPFDPDNTDPDIGPPHFMQGTLILERALMYCAMWPGSGQDQPNPYFNLKLAQQHENLYEKRMVQMEKEDNEHMQRNVWYQNWQATNRGQMSSTWWQSHAPGGW